MGRILLVSSDEDFLELVRLSFEERFGCEVICSPNDKDGIRQLQRRADFDVIVSEYNILPNNGFELLRFRTSSNMLIPFFIFTDATKMEILYSPNSFVGVFRKNQFTQLSDSIEYILRKNYKT